MVNFDWRRIIRCEQAISDILADFIDAVEKESDLVDPAVLDLVRDLPIGPDDIGGMRERSHLIFHAFFRLNQAHSRLVRASEDATTLMALDQLEHRGLWSEPDPKA